MRTRWIAPSLAMALIVLAPFVAQAAHEREVVRVRDLTIPAGTALPLVLDSYVATDTSHVESPVRAHLKRAVVVNGVTVIPAGTAVTGYVTRSERAGRVSGRSHLAFRFTQMSLSSPNRHFGISTSSVARTGRSAKGRDATTIGIPAAGGAVIGAIAGGKKGAAIGAAAGGAGGTAVVMSTRGPDVRMGRGALVTVRLLEPVTIRVPR